MRPHTQFIKFNCISSYKEYVYLVVSDRSIFCKQCRLFLNEEWGFMFFTFTFMLSEWILSIELWFPKKSKWFIIIVINSIFIMMVFGFDKSSIHGWIVCLMKFNGIFWIDKQNCGPWHTNPYIFHVHNFIVECIVVSTSYMVLKFVWFVHSVQYMKEQKCTPKVNMQMGQFK